MTKTNIGKILLNMYNTRSEGTIACQCRLISFKNWTRHKTLGLNALSPLCYSQGIVRSWFSTCVSWFLYIGLQTLVK